MIYSQLFPKLALSFISILTCSVLPLNNALALDKSSNNLQNSYSIAQATTNSISTEQIKEVAKNQNAT